MTEKRIRLGVISTASIGVDQVIPAMQLARNCDVTAIASRRMDAAAAAADDLGIADAYGSYEALLEESSIDAVYIPLPNDLHAEWVVRAAEAGKHILCEKPLAMTSVEATEMVDSCAKAGVKLQEAFMYRHHPTWIQAIRLVRSGAIGTVTAVQSWFSYYNDDPTNIRNRPENGGGAIMDIGCYNINLSRMVFEAEPVTIQSAVTRDDVLGVDVLSSVILEFPGGLQSSFTCSIRSEPDQRVHIVGTDGRIDIEIPFNIPTDRETRIRLTNTAGDTEPPGTEVIRFPAANQYTIQAELFADAILTGGPVAVHPSDAVANMKVIEAILGA